MSKEPQTRKWTLTKDEPPKKDQTVAVIHAIGGGIALEIRIGHLLGDFGDNYTNYWRLHRDPHGLVLPQTTSWPGTHYRRYPCEKQAAPRLKPRAPWDGRATVLPSHPEYSKKRSYHK